MQDRQVLHPEEFRQSRNRVGWIVDERFVADEQVPANVVAVALGFRNPVRLDEIADRLPNALKPPVARSSITFRDANTATGSRTTWTT